MATSNTRKAMTMFEGIGARDADLATKHINPDAYVEHNPDAGDGLERFREYIDRFPPGTHLQVVRAFEDGPYVFTQTDGHTSAQKTFFDVFRFEDGLIVEHWVFSAKAGPANQSGHTQTDGPTQAKHLEDTEKNKIFVRKYYETFHVAGDRSQNADFFTGDLMIRHEPGVRDGVTEFLRDVEMLMQHRTINEVKLLLGQGDFVFIAGKGTHEGAPCAYIDLYRVEDEKIVEHWGFPARIPPQEERRNNNGVL